MVEYIPPKYIITVHEVTKFTEHMRLDMKDMSRKDEVDILSYRIMLYHQDFCGEQITGYWAPAILPHRDAIRLPGGSVSSATPLDGKAIAPCEQ